MSPTVFRYGKYQFYFFSLEENRMHIHVHSPDGEAKFWLEPVIALANSQGLSAKEIRQMQKIVEERQDEIKRAWKKFFRC
jgi:hypothetical protein